MIFMSMISCAELKRGALVIDPEFEPYVTRFVSLSQKTNRPMNSANVGIQFDDNMDSQTLGICSYGSMEIRINSKLWKKLSPSSKEMLIFHELGHCILKRDHIEKSVLSSDARDTLQISLMASRVLRSIIYERNYETYISELFNGDRGHAYFSYGVSKFNSAYYTTASNKPKQAAAKSSATEVQVDNQANILSLNCE
jgi:hypothetical protein